MSFSHSVCSFGMQLLIACGIDHYGRTIHLWDALLQYEDHDSYVWAFTTFRRWIGVDVWDKKRVIFHDRLKTFFTAIPATQPSVTQLDCSWHLNETAKSKLHSPDAFVLFGQAMKAMDEPSFEDIWTELTGLQLTPAEQHWITTEYDNRQRWAYCFMEQHFTAGAHTTQRGESMNAVGIHSTGLC